MGVDDDNMPNGSTVPDDESVEAAALEYASSGPDKPISSLKARAIFGSAWTFVGYGFSQVLALAANLILGWTNNDFDVFTSTAEVITSVSSTGSGKYADADDAISYNAYDRFRVTVDGTLSAGFQLAWGGYNLGIADEYDQVIIPAAAGSTTPRLSATVGGAVTMTDVTITIKKIYGL